MSFNNHSLFVKLSVKTVSERFDLLGIYLIIYEVNRRLPDYRGDGLCTKLTIYKGTTSQSSSFASLTSLAASPLKRRIELPKKHQLTPKLIKTKQNTHASLPVRTTDIHLCKTTTNNRTFDKARCPGWTAHYTPPRESTFSYSLGKVQTDPLQNTLQGSL